MTALDGYLREVRAALGGCDETTKRDLLDEIADHIEERVRALQLAGASEEEAMNETIDRFGTAREIGGQLRAIHGRVSHRDALLAAIPPVLLALGEGLILAFYLSRALLVVGGATPAWQAWKPDAPIIGAGTLIIAVLTLLTLAGGALVALVRRLPPWAGPWLGAAAMTIGGLLVVLGESAANGNVLLQLLVALVMLAWVLWPLVLTAWQSVRSGLLAGLTMGMVFAQMLLIDAWAVPLQRFDAALLGLPLGLAQGALLYLIARGDPVKRWSLTVLALLLNAVAVRGVYAVWQDAPGWRYRLDRPDTSLYFVFLSVCPVLVALVISAARWGWGRLRARLVAG